MPTQIKPKRDEPQPTANLLVLKFKNKGLPKSGKAPAIILLNKSLPANTEAKYLQNDILR